MRRLLPLEPMKPRAHFFGGVILAGAFVGGCNLAPSYHPPDSDSSSAFKEAVRADIKPDGGWNLADPEDEQLRALTVSVGLIKNLGGGWDASRLPSLAFTHPSRPRWDTSGNIEAPNPPVVPPAVKTPEERLQEDERDTKSKP